MDSRPYISFVVTTRNDNHGGDLLKRTECFLRGLYHQAAKFKLPIELIVVEWNPPADRPLLKDVLPVPPPGCPIEVRFIVVPNTIHQQYKMANDLPLFQMTAKNVGIRRAAGEFVLCTNIDLLFSDQLFKFLAERRLKTGKFYRAMRADVPKAVMDLPDLEQQLTYAQATVIAWLGKGRGNEYLFGLPSFFYAFTGTMRLLNQVFRIMIETLHSKEVASISSLDTHACGDFTLMSKDDWLKIEGYPELDLYSIHIDSMAIVAARALGIEQEILPREACSFHIFHEDGWESFKANPIGLIKFIEKRPGLDWYSVSEAGKWLLKNNCGWGLNRQDWGWANESFQEYSFQLAEA
jgi:hypothetical protein